MNWKPFFQKKKIMFDEAWNILRLNCFFARIPLIETTMFLKHAKNNFEVSNVTTKINL